jgi:hypothetical protein
MLYDMPDDELKFLYGKTTSIPHKLRLLRNLRANVHYKDANSKR